MSTPVILITGALTGYRSRHGACLCAIGFLGSNKASFITGQIVRDNGGKTAS
jgi:hypothetical protein